MNTLKPVLAAMATAALAGLGTAHAAPMQNQTVPDSVSVVEIVTVEVDTAAVAPTALDRMRERVVLKREADQQRAITRALDAGRIDLAQAEALRTSASDIAFKQLRLEWYGGREDVKYALVQSHRQNVLDWAIATGKVEYLPQALRRLS